MISDPAAAMRRDQTATNVAIVTGVIFIVAGLVKFVFHGWELHAFREFGLPWPAALEILAGVVEIVGGRSRGRRSQPHARSRAASGHRLPARARASARLNTPERSADARSRAVLRAWHLLLAID